MAQNCAVRQGLRVSEPGRLQRPGCEPARVRRVPPPMVEAVIFDVDGTLVDSVDLHAQAWADAFHHFGYDVSAAQARTQIGKGGDQLMPVFVPRADLDRIGKTLEKWRGDHFRAEYLPRVRAFPDVRALFDVLLVRGIRLVHFVIDSDWFF